MCTIICIEYEGNFVISFITMRLFCPVQVKDDIEPSILSQSDETGAIQVEYKLHELPDGQVAAVPME